jgi:hypothetical protein
LAQFVSAIGAFAGCFVGLVASHHSPEWILAFTAGGFVYISLVSIVPGGCGISLSLVTMFSGRIGYLLASRAHHLYVNTARTTPHGRRRTIWRVRGGATAEVLQQDDESRPTAPLLQGCKEVRVCAPARGLALRRRCVAV